jgi:hypothetical protein
MFSKVCVLPEHRQEAYDLLEKVLRYYEVTNDPVDPDEFFDSYIKGMEENGHIEPGADFSHEQHEAGDWYIDECDDKDCEIGWHKTGYALNVYRKNGVKVIKFMSVDEDRDWDTGFYWESNDSWSTADVELGSYVGLDQYFYGWAKYYCYCYEEWEDPASNFFSSPPNKEQEASDGSSPEDLTKAIEQWESKCLDGLLDNMQGLNPKALWESINWCKFSDKDLRFVTDLLQLEAPQQ